MEEPRQIRQQIAVLTDLQQLVNNRTKAVEEAEERHDTNRAAVERDFAEESKRVNEHHQSLQNAADREFQATTRRIDETFTTQYRSNEQEFLRLQKHTNDAVNVAKTKAKKKLQESRWETQTVYDATKNKPKREFLELEKQVNARSERLQAVVTAAQEFLASCRMARPKDELAPPPGPPSEEPEALKRFLNGLTKIEEQLVELRSIKLVQMFEGGGKIVGMFLGLFAVFAGAIGAAFSYNPDQLAPWLGISGVLAALVCGGIAFVLFKKARVQADEVYRRLRQTVVDTEAAKNEWHEKALADSTRRTNEIQAKYDSDIERAEQAYAKSTEGMQGEHAAALKAQEKYPPILAELKKKHQAERGEVVAKHNAANAERNKLYQEELAEVNARHERALATCEANYEHDWQVLAETWKQGLAKIYASAEEVNQEADRVFPAWSSEAWDHWIPQHEVSPTIRFGQVEVNLADIPNGIPDDPRLATNLPTSLHLPALLSFPKRCSLLLRAGGTGRGPAVNVLQAVMLRMLTAIPPGKLRFTIVDPVGLGQNFAGFMHLADYDEQLVNFRIHTEPSHIERTLADLTHHMSTVIQKYLRSEYETIEEYNSQAGEVAEPFRVLVVANFPFNFTDAATRHLVSIASTGARCGVYTLISFDPKLPLPHGFRATDLDDYGMRLLWKEGNFLWKDDRFEKFPLVLDEPPESERFTQIVHMVGEGAKNSNRVEVPFEFIAPERSKWWTGDSAKGIDIALGRAGATKRQHLQLGRGTAQHVLIAGKTGSGKSTLLHALITNLALQYSPDEVELYLIDFKKGVEFKTYAMYQLPHARVIAIESEREFGLSVLQRLDKELIDRGELFRQLDVADLGGYRRNHGKERMPRILLIIDEFQEFFTEDDKIAQDAALLFDRLVRQGRAFGIHVHLGSQTLGGAYSLARSTLGQMAIRIALQCSEADANLILSEENTAARLLTRPGEAIYNDANGRSEGNSLFQVVWLADDKHVDYLQRVHTMAKESGRTYPPQIIFEGNAPADPNKNTLFNEILNDPAWAKPKPSLELWLGDAIAIKDPTNVTLRRQSGSNLLMIGQQPEATLAMLSVGLVALASQYPPAAEGQNGESAGPRFYILDGQSSDAEFSYVLPRLVTTLPHPCEVGGPRDVSRIIGELSDELTRRQTSDEAEPPPMFLTIYDLAKFRELRKADDDFGFSREDKPSPSKQFIQLLREGPALGIHVIVWCDNLANVQRTFDRATIREFETRVLFQMSVSDSSSLVDSPVASKLGPNRGLFHSEEQGRLEKFRPYSLPTDEWLKQVSERLRQKTRPTANGAKSKPAAEASKPAEAAEASE